MAASDNIDPNFTNICGKLDNLAIQILNVMQTIVYERQYLDESLRDGYINMAKSRYLMRGQKINTFQINTSNLRASKKITRDTENGNGIEFPTFHVSNSTNRCMEDDHLVNAENGLRNLKIGKVENSYEFNNSKKDFSNDDNSSANNPLQWFGVLVPPSLKNCQARFEQVIETVTKLTTLQSQLIVLSQEYRNLREQKSVCFEKS